VKGHATQDDIDAGRSTPEDQQGNDNSDASADKGVQAIGGEGLVKLAKWAAERHASYKKLLARIHKFIAAMTVVEKEEREKAAKIDKMVKGYDQSKWIKSNGTIRHEDQANIKYDKLILPPPITGRHKFSQCQDLYEQIHTFIANRQWAHAHPES
jgi:hypothetical protein